MLSPPGCVAGTGLTCISPPALPPRTLVCTSKARSGSACWFWAEFCMPGGSGASPCQRVPQSWLWVTCRGGGGCAAPPRPAAAAPQRWTLRFCAPARGSGAIGAAPGGQAPLHPPARGREKRVVGGRLCHPGSGAPSCASSAHRDPPAVSPGGSAVPSAALSLCWQLPPRRPPRAIPGHPRTRVTSPRVGRTF